MTKPRKRTSPAGRPTLRRCRHRCLPTPRSGWCAYSSRATRTWLSGAASSTTSATPTCGSRFRCPTARTAQGKKVLLNMIPEAGDDVLLCVDSTSTICSPTARPSRRRSTGVMFSTLSPTPPRIICVMRPRCTMSASKRPRTIPHFRFRALHARILLHDLSVVRVVRLLGAVGHGTHLHAVDFKSSVRLHLTSPTTARGRSNGWPATWRNAKNCCGSATRRCWNR